MEEGRRSVGRVGGHAGSTARVSLDIDWSDPRTNSWITEKCRWRKALLVAKRVEQNNVTDERRTKKSKSVALFD
jgi:hypothetical protein